MAGTTEASRACVHLWDVEPAAGPTASARCVHCGAVGEFKNVLDSGTDLFNLSSREKAQIDGYYRDITRERLARRRES